METALVLAVVSVLMFGINLGRPIYTRLLKMNQYQVAYKLRLGNSCPIVLVHPVILPSTTTAFIAGRQWRIQDFGNKGAEGHGERGSSSLCLSLRGHAPSGVRGRSPWLGVRGLCSLKQVIFVIRNTHLRRIL